MDRTPITADVVKQFERMLAQGQSPQQIAAELGITDYVAGLLAKTAGRPLPKMRPHKTDRRVRNHRRGIDATTVRSIRRMLAGRWLTHQEIAREVGVSANLVAQVAAGHRLPKTIAYPVLEPGEWRVDEPVRCGGCGLLLSVLPCRLCRIEAARLVDRIAGRKNFCGISETDFLAWKIFGVLLTGTKRNTGGRLMQQLLPIITDELSAFLKAKDKREFLITRCEHYFDELVQPVDLPGPDRVIDPVLRSTIRPLVGRLYDAAVEKLEAQSHAA